MTEQQTPISLCSCPSEQDWRKLGGGYYCVLPHPCWSGKYQLTCYCTAFCCVWTQADEEEAWTKIVILEPEPRKLTWRDRLLEWVTDKLDDIKYRCG